MCGVCSKSFSVRKTNHIPDHLRMLSHVRATQLNKPKQTVLILCPSGRPQKEDEFTLKFTEAWIESGLSLSALLPGKKLRYVLEDGFRRPLPSVSTLASSYATAAFTKKREKLIEILQEFPAFYIIFDEADYHGEKYYAFRIGKLGSEKSHPPFLIEITREANPPDSVMVQQKLLGALTGLKLVDQFSKFRLFLTDAASYCVAAGNALKMTYTDLIHITCFSHMLSRVLTAIPETRPGAKKLVQLYTNFEKSPRRANFLANHGEKKLKYPIPVETRRGTWLDSVCFISDNWKQLMQFFDERDDNRDNEKARKLFKKMKCALVAKEIGFIAALRFVRENITESESSDFTATKAVKVLDSLFSKLHDFSETHASA